MYILRLASHLCPAPPVLAFPSESPAVWCEILISMSMTAKLRANEILRVRRGTCNILLYSQRHAYLTHGIKQNLPSPEHTSWNITDILAIQYPTSKQKPSDTDQKAPQVEPE